MNKQMNAWQFSRKTRTGALVLMVLLLIFIVLWRLLPSLVQPRPDAEHKALAAAWTRFKEKHIEVLPDKDAQQYAWQGRSKYNHDTQEESKAQSTARPAPFDPNAATEAELVEVGFPPRTAKTMIKYRSKGGKFRKKEDLQKLYTLSAEDYERIAPYARFGNEAPASEQYIAGEASFKNNAPQRRSTLELNNADADALMSLPGIGPAFSKRIINFRTALGGFASVEQLKEVYGFPDSTYQQLKDRFTLNTGNIKKLNINMATEQELGKHPYLGWKLAAGIIKRRNELGNYSQLEQLKQVPLINDEKYRKIAPYLSVH